MDSDEPRELWATMAEFERKHHAGADWVLVGGGVPGIDGTPAAIRAWLETRVRTGVLDADAIQVETTYCDGSSRDSCDYLRFRVKRERA